jgi:hypothetical protein
MFSCNNRTDIFRFSVAVTYDRGQSERGIYKRLQEKEHKLFERVFVCVFNFFTLKKLVLQKC